MFYILFIVTVDSWNVNKISNISRCRNGNCQCYIGTDTLVLQEQQFGTCFAHSVWHRLALSHNHPSLLWKLVSFHTKKY